MNYFPLIFMMLLSGILGLSIVNYIVNRRIKEFIRGGTPGIGVNSLKASLFIFGALLISEVSYASKEVFNAYLIQSGGQSFLIILGYWSMFSCSAFLITVILIYVSRLVYSIFTKGKNIYEMSAANEIADIVLFAGIFGFIVLVIKPGFSDLLLQAIRYSTTPVFH